MTFAESEKEIIFLHCDPGNTYLSLKDASSGYNPLYLGRLDTNQYLGMASPPAGSFRPYFTWAESIFMQYDGTPIKIWLASTPPPWA